MSNRMINRVRDKKKTGTIRHINRVNRYRLNWIKIQIGIKTD